MLQPYQLDNLAKAASAAKQCEAATGLPAALTVAQWALESGWGLHSPGNNCFGIKEYTNCAATQDLTTREYVGGQPVTVVKVFAAFPTLADCFAYHAGLITQGAPYAAPWAAYQSSKDVAALAAGIAPVYATAPDYDRQLLAIMGMGEVQAALAAA